MRLYLAFCFLLVSGVFYSQAFDIKEINEQNLIEKEHPLYKDASAVIKFKKARTYFKFDSKNGFYSCTEVNLRIKIYKKEAYDWATFEIPYYVGYENITDENVEIIKAYTYNLEDGKIKKEKVTSTGKKNIEVNSLWSTKVVFFPNVKEGSIIDLKYVLKSENLSVLPDFQIQYNIPVDYAEYTTEIPEFYLYKVIQNGSISINSTEAIVNGSANLSNGSSLLFRNVKSKYVCENVPAFVKEGYVSNPENYKAKISLELKVIRMPDKEPKHISSTWEDVKKSIYDEDSFGREVEKYNYYSKDLNVLLKDSANNEAALKKIFDFVKNRMIWDGKYGYYTRKGVEAAYKENIGNYAEINLMLVSMYRLAGFKSYPLIISTRNNGIALFPNRSRMNAVICQVELNGKYYLLDATDKYAEVNFLPIRDLNWEGVKIDENLTSNNVDLMPKFISKNNLILIAAMKSNGEIEGKIRAQLFDYNAYNFRVENNGLAQENYLEKLEKRLNNSEVSDYIVENKTNLTKPIIETYAFKNSNSVETIGDKLYFSPFVFLAETVNPFKQDKREYPVDFIYPNQDRIMTILDIPEGYEVESLPESITLKFTDSLLEYKFNSSRNGNKIQMSSMLDFNTSVLNPEYYQELKSFFNEMIKKQTEKVVLKKV